MKPRRGLPQDSVLVIYLISGRGWGKGGVKVLSKVCCIDKNQSVSSTAVFCLMPTSVSKVGFCKVSTLLTKIELGLLITHYIIFYTGCLGFFYLLFNQSVNYLCGTGKSEQNTSSGQRSPGELSSSRLDSCGFWCHRKLCGNISIGRRLHPLCNGFPILDIGIPQN